MTTQPYPFFSADELAQIADLMRAMTNGDDLWIEGKLELYDGCGYRLGFIAIDDDDGCSFSADGKDEQSWAQRAPRMAKTSNIPPKGNA